MSWLGDLRVTIFALLLFIFAALDIELGKQLDQQVDITFMLTAMGAVGIGAAHSAGVSSSATTVVENPAPIPPTSQIPAPPS